MLCNNGDDVFRCDHFFLIRRNNILQCLLCQLQSYFLFLKLGSGHDLVEGTFQLTDIAVTVRFRVGQPYRSAALCAYAGDTLLKRIPKRILTPGEMESFPIDPAAIPADADTVTFVVEEAQAQ